MPKTVALILGSSGGIGQAIARTLASQFTHIYATYRTNEATVRLLKESCPRSTFVKCDLRNSSDVDNLIQMIRQREAQIDLLVHCATTPLLLKTFDQLSMDEIEQDIAFLLGTIRLAKHSINLMKPKRTGTLIFFLTAALTNLPSARLSSYLIVKHAIYSFIKTATPELSPFGIRLVGISPSFVETDLIRPFPAPLLEMEKKKQPNGKFLQPEQLAKLVSAIVRFGTIFPSGEHLIIRNLNDINQLLGRCEEPPCKD